ncbi:transcription factor bHLH110-like [Alnus glutinosa]|uniref:transcription factor bHLH110-like n=1 Tax=Alnus glutinosa TaxID=3517 RepID=UPI002D790EDA|nr:transcription factor bHLH110-like [Alnus glutinosa]
MESTNIHHQHQLQEQLTEYIFTSATHQSGYKASATHDWSPSIVLNGSNYNSYLTAENVPSSRESWQKFSIDDPLLSRPSVICQDLRFCDGKSTQQSANELLHLAKFKEEVPDTFPKLSEIVCSLSDISEESHSLPTKHEQQCSANYLCENLCLGNFSSGGQIPGQQPSAGDLYSNSHNPTSFGGVPGSNRYNFSHVFPFFSPSDLSTSLASNSLGLNLQTLDLLTSTNYGGNFSQASHDVIGAPKGSTSLSPDHMHMQDLADSPSNSSNKTSGLMNGVTRTKRQNVSEPKEFYAETKKSRSVSRCPCPPLKVRKEKLGDRIAALQKLVAPFGKTDTASVLTEAIGYIQFLHDQVQTLSTPYLKSSHSKPIRAMQPGLMKEDGAVPKRDLRSRGLCLLPLSCASYISGYD